MVALEQDNVIGTLEMVSPMIDYFNNHQKLSIIHVIVPFFKTVFWRGILKRGEES